MSVGYDENKKLYKQIMLNNSCLFIRWVGW